MSIVGGFQTKLVGGFNCITGNNPGSGGPFTPLSISPVLWLRADKGITIGTGVSGWADQSGSGDANRNFSQSTGASQPTLNASDAAYNNQATLSFSSQCLNSGTWSIDPISQPYTYFVVGNDDGTNNTQIYIGDFALDNWRLAAYGSVTGTYVTSVGNTTSLGVAVSNAPKIFDLEINDSSSQAWINSTIPTATGLNTISGTIGSLTLGGVEGNGNLNGKIAEVVIFNRVLSSSDRASMLSYLGTRYNITYQISSPLALSPKAWFRSDLGVSQTAGLVSAWADQSGNGYNLTQSNALNYPSYSATGGPNSRPSITFGAIADTCLYNTSFTFSMQPVEIFAVMTCSNPTVESFPWDLGVQNDSVISDGGQYYTFNQAYGNSLVAPAMNTPHVLDVYYNGDTTSFIALNGGTAVSGTSETNASQSAAQLTVGSYSLGTALSFPGQINEFIVFNRKLNGIERAELLAYITNTYGIAT